jgi:hypothetical protein
VLAGELVGAVDAAVAGGAERGLVGAAEHGGRLDAADVALHTHGDQVKGGEALIEGERASGWLDAWKVERKEGREKGGEVILYAMTIERDLNAEFYSACPHGLVQKIGTGGVHGTPKYP